MIKIDPRRLSGTIPAIQSKSHLHRLLICQALTCQGDTICDISKVPVANPSIDVKATMDCLEHLDDENPRLNCGESGSTLRFLVPLASALGKTATFLGEGRLPHRPLEELLAPLEKNGVSVSPGGGEGEILTVTGQLRSGDYHLPGNISSQYVTGLLLALPLLDGHSHIHLSTPLESTPYVDMTLQALKEFSVDVDVIFSEDDEFQSAGGCQGSNVYRNITGFHIRGGQRYISPEAISVEGDWSNSAFWLVANQLGSNIEVTGLNPNSLQGDAAIIKSVNDSVVDASNIPDLVPILAVNAMFKGEDTQFKNCGRLRIKESDRVATSLNMLQSLGGRCKETSDGFVVFGKKTSDSTIGGGIVDSFNDHRIAMASAIAAVGCQGPVTIVNPHAVNKSYPNFFRDYKYLGGEVIEFNNR